MRATFLPVFFLLAAPALADSAVYAPGEDVCMMGEPEFEPPARLVVECSKYVASKARIPAGDRVRGYAHRGVAYLKLNKLDEAFEDFSYVIAKAKPGYNDLDLITAFGRRSFIYEQRGEADKADADDRAAKGLVRKRDG